MDPESTGNEMASLDRDGSQLSDVAAQEGVGLTSQPPSVVNANDNEKTNSEEKVVLPSDVACSTSSGLRSQDPLGPRVTSKTTLILEKSGDENSISSSNTIVTITRNKSPTGLSEGGIDNINIQSDSDGESSVRTNTSSTSRNLRNRKRKAARKLRKSITVSHSVVKVETHAITPENENVDLDFTLVGKNGKHVQQKPTGHLTPDEGNMKRNRSENDTPDSCKNQDKKQKTDKLKQTITKSTKSAGHSSSATSSKKSFAEAANNSFLVFIRFSNDVKSLDKGACDFLKNEITKSQYSMEQTQSGYIPKFVTTYIREYEMKVECVDKRSQQWLLDIISKLTDYKNEPFVAYSLADRPKLSNFTVFFYGKQDPDPTSLLKRLNLSNPGLFTDRWKVLFAHNRVAGFVLGVGVDAASLRHLKELEMRPYFEMGRVSFYVLESNKPE